MLRKTVPLLPSKNIRESIDFYEAKLGFSAMNYGNYAILNYQSSEIHLVMTAEKSPGCLIMVDNIEDLYTMYCCKGLLQKSGKLKDMPWGLKEFTIKDNNDNLLRFAQKR